jgi:hypothetical protein
MMQAHAVLMLPTRPSIEIPQPQTWSSRVSTVEEEPNDYEEDSSLRIHGEKSFEPTLRCFHCGKRSNSIAGGTSEKCMFRVKLLDRHHKSYFCDEACYSWYVFESKKSEKTKKKNYK